MQEVFKDTKGKRTDIVRARRGFSLLELMVVMAVIVILTGLLFPTLGGVRENLHRIVCASNLRQIGMGVHMFATDNNEDLPQSSALAAGRPDELMVAFEEKAGHWDGLGMLFGGGYCAAPECYYCPSHHGQHTPDRYDWYAPVGQRIYMNYHYSGHVEWEQPNRQRRLEDEKLVLATDGLREESDYNHESGMNILRGDGSVRWFESPGDGLIFGNVQANNPNGIWGELERRVQ